MKKIYTIFVFLSLISTTITSQFIYTPATAYNVKGSYVDLGSTGTQITTANNDNANSTALPIGFNFNYNGTNYSHFILNTNGFIKLGTSAGMSSPSSPALAYTYFNQNNVGGVLNSTNVNDVDILSVFNHDLDNSISSITEYRYLTTGTTGNRICTIQYKNVADKNILDSNNNPLPHVQFSGMNFQIKLYEYNRMIEFVYGNFIPTNDTCLFKLAGVGLKGSSNAQMITASKASSHEYSLAEFAAGYYTGVNTIGFSFGNNNRNIGKVIPQHTIRPLPEPGRTLRFLPTIANDAEVRQIYTYHAVTIPWGLPNTITTRVKNVGTGTVNNLTVYCTVSGANNYNSSNQITSLGVGLTSVQNFTGYTPQNLGTDTITITIDSDGEELNNHTAWIQKVSHHGQGYADSTPTFSNFGWGAGSGIFLAKYHVTGKRRISKIYAKIGFTTTNVGQTVYAVVVDANTTILGRSPDFVIGPNDLGEWREFEIFGGDNTNFDRPPPVFTNADYYAGLAVPGSGYNPMSLQREFNPRIGAYFYKGGVTSGGTYVDIATAPGLDVFRICVNSRMDGTSLKLEPITSVTNPSCASPNETIEITVTNLDTFTVDFSIDTMHLEVTATGPIPQNYSVLINSGTLEPDSSASFVLTNNFDFSAPGTYTLKFEARQWLEVDTANNYRTFVVNVVDTPRVKLNVSPDSIVCAGVPVVFTAIPFTAGSTLYQWKINGINQGGTTTTNTLSPSVVWGDVVSVDLITDHCTTSTFTIPSNEIMMKIKPKPRLINGITVDTVIQMTKKNYAIGVITGHSYIWRASGGIILGDTTSGAIQVEWGGPSTNASVSVLETDLTNCTYESILPVVVISIDGIAENQGVRVGEAYPNPADNTVNIPVYISVNSEIKLQLFDLTGKVVADVFNGRVTGSRVFKIDVSALNEGLYFYKLTDSEGYQQVRRLAIKH